MMNFCHHIEHKAEHFVHSAKKKVLKCLGLKSVKDEKKICKTREKILAKEISAYEKDEAARKARTKYLWRKVRFHVHVMIAHSRHHSDKLKEMHSHQTGMGEKHEVKNFRRSIS